MEPTQKSPAFLMRVMKFAFLVSFVLFIVVVIRTPSQAQQLPDPTLEWSVTTIALICAAVGFRGREFLGRFAQKMSANTTGSNPLQLWMARNIFSLACMEACVLFGVVLHFLGARVGFVEFLFSVGIIALLFWSPGVPPAAEQGQTTQG